MAIATVSRFYLGDSHVASLLGMTFGAVAIIATPFEQWRCLGADIPLACAARSQTSSRAELRFEFCPSYFESKEGLRDQ